MQATRKEVEPRENLVLAALTNADLERLIDRLEPVKLADEEVLWESDEKGQHLYFPVSALISLFYESDNGSRVSIATIGRHGVVGTGIVMSTIKTPDLATVTHGGMAFRLRATSVKKEFADCSDFQALLVAYTQSLIVKISQNAICNRLHRIDQQLCRWFLDWHNELKSREVRMTHEQIAQILGVRRESVSLAASELQKQKLIKGGRGKLSLLNLDGLANAACECYAVVKDQDSKSLSAFRAS
jgi:CRP-like cAMP-binding protein